MNTNDTDKRLEEFYGDFRRFLEAFGGLILLRQTYKITPLSHTDIIDEAERYIERNKDTIYTLLRT